MLSRVVAGLLVVWVIAVITGNLFGGLTHLLLVGAGVLFIIRPGQGQNPLRRG